MVQLRLAALLPLYRFLGWEGAADLAEETTDPGRNTESHDPRQLRFRDSKLFMIIGFLVAIPHGVAL